MKTSSPLPSALATFMLSILCQAAYGQVDPVWSMRYTEPGCLTNVPVATAVDGAGNCYVAGYTADAGATNGWVILKYSSAGALLWDASYAGSTNGDRPAAMTLDANGNIYITGYAYNPVSSNDIATVKYDSGGNLLWAHHYYRTNGDDQPRAIAVDSSGNVYVVGTGYLSTTCDPYGRGCIANSSYVTVKYDSAGNLLWARGYTAIGSGFGNQDAQSVAVDVVGNVYVAGVSVYAGDPRSCGYRFAMVKYAPNGDQLNILIPNLGAYFFGYGTGSNARIRLAIGPSNEVYAAGTIQSTGPFQYVVLKFTNDVQAWSQQYYGINPYTGDNQLQAIAVDKNSNLYLCGHGGNMSGVMVCMTMKYDPAGNQLWSVAHNRTGTNNEYARAMALDENGNAYVSAFSMGASNTSAFVTLKYASSGLPLWVAEYTAEGAGANEPKALALNSGRAVYVTGASPGGSGQNMTTLKYNAANQANMTWLNGSITLSTVAAPGSTNWLQVSSDLKNWSDVCSSVTRVDGVCFFPCISEVLTNNIGFLRISYR